MPVAVISAFLTFFPVTINTLRGLDSTDPRKLELMRSYAASGWSTLWKRQVPVRAAVHLLGLQGGGDGQRRRRHHRRAAVLDPGRARRRDPQLHQYYSLDPSALWATNIIAAALGILFFSIVAIVERLVVRRAPENVA